MIEEIQNLTLKVAQLTNAFNSLVSNSKDIDSLPAQITFSETSKLHVSNNGISEKLEVSKILDAFDGGLENWSAKVYTNYIAVVRDNSIYILNSNVMLPYNSIDFDAELSNDIWVKLYSGTTALTTDTNLDDLLTPGEYIFNDGVEIYFTNNDGTTKYFSSTTNINILYFIVNDNSSLIRVIVEKHKQAPNSDGFDMYTQTVIYGDTQKNIRVFKRVFTSKVQGHTDFVELTNNLSASSTITEVTTFTEITNGDSGLYYLTAQDNTDPNNVKDVGEYIKLSDGSTKSFTPKILQNYSFGGLIEINNTSDYVTFHALYGIHCQGTHNQNIGNNLFNLMDNTSVTFVAPYNCKLYVLTGAFRSYLGTNIKISIVKGDRVGNSIANTELLLDHYSINTSHASMENFVNDVFENKTIDKGQLVFILFNSDNNTQNQKFAQSSFNLTIEKI